MARARQKTAITTTGNGLLPVTVVTRTAVRDTHGQIRAKGQEIIHGDVADLLETHKQLEAATRAGLAKLMEAAT